MSSRAPFRLAATAVVLLALTGSALSAATAASSPGPGKTGPGKTVAGAQESVSVGVIVQTSRTTPTGGDVSRIARAASESADAVTAIDEGLVTVVFETPVPTADAAATAEKIADLPGVEHAEPDVLLTRAAAAPSRPDDPLFGELVGVWDERNFQATRRTRSDYANGWTAGGFSVRAPYLWRATTGSESRVVAVIDTGFTAHPDLDANRVDGYDFQSAAADTDASVGGRDGDAPIDAAVPGWDGDASDPGDYAAVGECGATSQSTSSWHGTHVAGTVAAVDDNGMGVTGVAPDVRYQPIRVLGPCGGSTSDVAIAIQWAAGVSIPGVPANTTPAKVVNLSLGSGGQCDVTMQDAVSAARAQGAVVVAAAGNEGVIGLGSPASCTGVVAVTATDEFGQSASYSNVGSRARRADISAPGGDLAYAEAGYSGILSTIDTGATGPAGPGYTEYDGTSMATPHVAAGAALLSSLGYTRSEVEKALRYAVRPFADYNSHQKFDCTSSQAAKSTEWDCGRGILDLAKVPALYGSTTITGTARKGKSLVISTQATAGTRTYRWYRNGKAIKGATRSTYKLMSADRGRDVSVKVTVAKSGFKTLSATSAARTVAR